MNNTFDGTNKSFPNKGIHFLLAEIVTFRKQLTVRNELQSQSGWPDALNKFMVDQLEKLADTLESITYNPTGKTQEELESEAADTSRSLLDDYGPDSITSDNILMPVGVASSLSWDLTGGDPDIPQLTPLNCPNDHGRDFITGLDCVFKELTRLDSRHQPTTITKNESVMIRALLNELMTVCQRKGGEVNRSDIATGTLPSQEPGPIGGPSS